MTWNSKSANSKSARGLIAGKTVSVYMVGICMVGMGSAAALAANPPRYGTFATPMYSATIDAPNHPGAAQALAGSGDTSPAPVPDTDLYAPVLRTLGPAQPEFAPSMFRSRTTYRGEGYMPGSTVQANEERRQGPTAGVNMSVPLD